MRKTKPKKRYHQPDMRYNDTTVTQFINKLMYSGKKSVAAATFYNAMDIIEEKTGENGYEVWKKALATVGPAVEVRTRRIGGANFQIPTEVRPIRKFTLATKWIVDFSRKRNGHSMAEKLSAELMAAAKGEGSAVKKKEDTHKMAEANKAFAHFRT